MGPGDRRRCSGFCRLVRPVPDRLAGAAHEVRSEAAPYQLRTDRIKQLLVACRSIAGCQTPGKIDRGGELGLWAEARQGLVNEVAIHASGRQLRSERKRAVGVRSPPNVALGECGVVLQAHLA